MKTLKDIRQERGISQQELSRITTISQTTISNLEREITAPTNNQRLLLEQALGPVDWPVNREFSVQERTELVQAFAVLVDRKGPRQALDLLATAKNNDELRGLASLFTPHVEPVECLTLPDHSRG